MSFMKSLQIVIIVLITMSRIVYSKKDYSIFFQTWINQVPVVKHGQQIQDSNFLCLCLLCDTPYEIKKHIQELKCLPTGMLDSKSPYCVGDFCRLEFSNVDSCVIPLLFYIEADMDFTKSLILATFNCNGEELSSRVIASDDVKFRPLTNPSDSSTLNFFQYIILNNILYVRECHYNYKNLLLEDISIHAYNISCDGKIQEINYNGIKSLKIFDGIIPKKWEI